MSTQPTAMTEADWRALGDRLFGENTALWRFKCPSCGHVMAMGKARAMPEEAKAKLRNRWSIEQECVGRYLPEQGCDWCAYGLFNGPFFVTRGEKTMPVFGFDSNADRGDMIHAVEEWLERAKART